MAFERPKKPESVMKREPEKQANAFQNKIQHMRTPEQQAESDAREKRRLEKRLELNPEDSLLKLQLRSLELKEKRARGEIPTITPMQRTRERFDRDTTRIQQQSSLLKANVKSGAFEEQNIPDEQSLETNPEAANLESTTNLDPEPLIEAQATQPEAVTKALAAVRTLLGAEKWEEAAKMLKELPTNVFRAVATQILKNLPKISIVKVTAEQLVDILKGTAGRISNDILKQLNKFKPFEKGAWNKPDNLRPDAYIGTRIHAAIAKNYQDANSGDLVYLNYSPISTILGKSFPDANLSKFPKEKLGMKPDILNITKKHLYEIKSEASVADAVIERDVYIALFKMAGIEIFQGPSNAPGANGVVQAPGGHAIYYSPVPGVILYRKKNGDFDPTKVPITATLEEKEKQEQKTPVAPGTNPALAQSSLPEPLENLRLSMGLSVGAFLLYLIFSEGSRIVFPPRNLLPIP
jgi:hypothetical protein